MQPQMLQERPPFVMFETVSIEDREATISAGHYVGRDVDMAFITPAGSKDRIERVVSEWFKKLDDDMAAERIPRAWVDSYKAHYRAYKEGMSVPTSGTSIVNWPGLNPTLVKTLQSLHLLSIEDVSVMNEESIARVGMGGRALKQRAIDYLSASSNVGKVAEEVSALRTALADEKARNERNEERMATMAMQLQQLAGQPQGQSVARQSASAGISAADILDGPGDKL